MKNSVRLGLWVFALAMTQLLIFGDQAMAQPGRGGRGGMRGGMSINKFTIVQNETVQKDLELDEEAIGKLEKLTEEAREEMAKAREENQGDFEAMFEAMGKINESMAGKVNELLSEKQQKRVNEIFLQVNGPSILSDKEVASMLKISEDQISELKDIEKSAQESLQEMFQDFRGMEREEVQSKMEEWQKDRDEKLLAVLNEEQAEAFEKAKGEKLDVSAADFRMGRRGGPGGPGAGRGGRGQGGGQGQGGQGRGGRRGGQRDGNNQDF